MGLILSVWIFIWIIWTITGWIHGTGEDDCE